VTIAPTLAGRLLAGVKFFGRHNSGAIVDGVILRISTP